MPCHGNGLVRALVSLLNGRDGRDPSGARGRSWDFRTGEATGTALGVTAYASLKVAGLTCVLCP